MHVKLGFGSEYTWFCLTLRLENLEETQSIGQVQVELGLGSEYLVLSYLEAGELGLDPVEVSLAPGHVETGLGSQSPSLCESSSQASCTTNQISALNFCLCQCPIQYLATEQNPDTILMLIISSWRNCTV